MTHSATEGSPLQQVLVGHDFSPEADRAVERALSLLPNHPQLRIAVAHVAEPTLTPEQVEQRRTQLERHLARHPAPLLTCYVRQGEINQELRTLVRGLNAQLLIVGPHHHNARLHFAGTTLDCLLLALSCPLLVALELVPAPYTRVLAALDFSPAASRALAACHPLLDTPSAQLNALNILESTGLQPAPEAEMALQRELFQALLEEQNSQAQLLLYQGERNLCLQQVIGAERPQLLTLGLHARGALSNTLVGSLVQALLLQPPCDLLISP